MKLTVENGANGEVILVVDGEVDMETSPNLRDEIKKHIKKKPSAIKLKLTSVPYIDSSGIAVLIEGMRWTKKKDIAYALVSPSDGVRDVLQMSKLLPVFTVEEG